MVNRKPGNAGPFLIPEPAQIDKHHSLRAGRSLQPAPKNVRKLL